MSPQESASEVTLVARIYYKGNTKIPRDSCVKAKIILMGLLTRECKGEPSRKPTQCFAVDWVEWNARHPTALELKTKRNRAALAVLDPAQTNSVTSLELILSCMALTWEACGTRDVLTVDGREAAITEHIVDRCRSEVTRRMS